MCSFLGNLVDGIRADENYPTILKLSDLFWNFIRWDTALLYKRKDSVNNYYSVLKTLLFWIFVIVNKTRQILIILFLGFIAGAL